jgi:hypothetical protein
MPCHPSATYDLSVDCGRRWAQLSHLDVGAIRKEKTRSREVSSHAGLLCSPRFRFQAILKPRCNFEDGRQPFIGPSRQTAALEYHLRREQNSSHFALQFTAKFCNRMFTC